MKIMLRGINERDENGGFIVYLNDRRLDPGPSQNVFNHSPDGFAWGYGGSGPAQLALAVLLVECPSKKIALANYQSFKWDVIAKLPHGNFEQEIDLSPYLKAEGIDGAGNSR